MRVLKVRAHQLFANYRKPLSFGFIDTYPLPPLSTIRGWFHTVVGAKEYIPLSMCIQGGAEAVVYDLQTLIKFDRKERTKQGYPLLEGFGKTLSQTPTYVANLFDVELTLYILAPEEHLQVFRENLLTAEYPHIGRYEDVARIDSVELIEPEKRSFTPRKAHTIDYGIYLKKETACNCSLSGINYRQNFKYEVIKGLRYFTKVDVVYVDNGRIESGTHLFDPEEGKEGRIVELIGDLTP